MRFRSSKSQEIPDTASSTSTPGQRISQSHTQSTQPTHSGMTESQAEDQYAVDISSRRQLNELQRLEQTHGRKVHDWVDEGMPREAMGSPAKMRAFRMRNDTPVLRASDTQNDQSRSANAAANTGPVGDTGVPESGHDVSEYNPGSPASQRVIQRMPPRSRPQNTRRSRNRPSAANSVPVPEQINEEQIDEILTLFDWDPQQQTAQSDQTPTVGEDQFEPPALETLLNVTSQEMMQETVPQQLPQGVDTQQSPMDQFEPPDLNVLLNVTNQDLMQETVTQQIYQGLETSRRTNLQNEQIQQAQLNELYRQIHLMNKDYLRKRK